MPTKEGGKLMCGGFWGISRHSNYAGDLTMGFTWFQQYLVFQVTVLGVLQVELTG